MGVEQRCHRPSHAPHIAGTKERPTGQTQSILGAACKKPKLDAISRWARTHGWVSWGWKKHSKYCARLKTVLLAALWKFTEKNSLVWLFVGLPWLAWDTRNNTVSSHKSGSTDLIKKSTSSPCKPNYQVITQYLDSKTEDKAATQRTCLSLSPFWKRAGEQKLSKNCCYMPLTGT